MNGYNFTDRVRKVLQMAREEAVRLRSEFVGPEHIMLGLVREGEGAGLAALQNVGVDYEGIGKALNKPAPTKGNHGIGPDLPYTARAKKVLELAMTEARELNHSYVGTEHLTLGIVREERSEAAKLMARAGVTLESLRSEILRLLGPESMSQESKLSYKQAHSLANQAVESGRILQPLDIGVSVAGVIAVLTLAIIGVTLTLGVFNREWLEHPATRVVWTLLITFAACTAGLALVRRSRR